MLRGKSGRLPDLVHTHPGETIAEAVHILQEYGVSQMPVVRAEPPIVAAEVAGSVSERTLLDALFTGAAKMTDRVEDHMSAALPTIGSTEAATDAVALLGKADAVLVQEDGKPIGVLTRQDLLTFCGVVRRAWATALASPAWGAGCLQRRRRHGTDPVEVEVGKAFEWNGFASRTAGSSTASSAPPASRRSPPRRSGHDHQQVRRGARCDLPDGLLADGEPVATVNCSAAKMATTSRSTSSAPA